MPIFEYICKDCKKRFETLVFGSQQAHCPLCQGTNLDQQISVFSVGSGGGSTRAGSRTSSCPAASPSCSPGGA